jgi:hypothetical protein
VLPVFERQQELREPVWQQLVVEQEQAWLPVQWPVWEPEQVSVLLVQQPVSELAPELQEPALRPPAAAPGPGQAWLRLPELQGLRPVWKQQPVPELGERPALRHQLPPGLRLLPARQAWAACSFSPPELLPEWVEAASHGARSGW